MSAYFFIAVIAVASAQKPAYSENISSHDGNTVLLGGLFPLSQSINNKCGPVRTSAVAAMEAMVFAIHQINKNTILLPGINLTYDIRDTCSIPNKALEQSLSYIRKNPSSHKEDKLAASGIVGAGLSSDVSQAVASLFRLFQIPQVSYGSSAVVLSDRVQYDYFFRTVPSDAYLARAMADTVNYFKWSYIIALHSDDTYGTTAKEIILKKIQQKGNKKCILRISIPVDNESAALFDDVVAQMNQPWVRNASVALLYGYQRQTMGIMAAIERLITQDPTTPLQYLTWVGCDALKVSQEYHYLLRGTILMQVSVKESQGFQDYFTSLVHFNATNPTLFREYWEITNNCKFADNACSYATPSEYLQRNEIASIIDAVHAYAHAFHGLIQTHCNSSKLCSKVLVTRSAGIAVNGTMIRDYFLRNLSFPGLSSDRVSFDSSGNDRSSYDVQNLQKESDGTYTYVSVGTWNTERLLRINGTMEWNGRRHTVPQSLCSYNCTTGYHRLLVPGMSQCCWTCQECPGETTYSNGISCSKCQPGSSPNANRSECINNIVTYLTWSNSLSIFILFWACAGIIATIFVIVVYAVFHNHTIIKASSRELSAILLFGLLLWFAIPFVFMVRPSPAICGIIRFAVGFSFATCFSALLVKTNRLHRIFNRSPDRLKIAPRFISPASQVVIVLILLSIQVVISILWLAIQHPGIVYVSEGRSTELQCSHFSTIGLFITLGYNLLLLILSTYFAFLARNIPENFNEAKFINVTLYTIIIIWLAFISMYFVTANLKAIYRSSSLLIAIVLSAVTTLGCLFMPKVYLLFLQKVLGMKGTITTNVSFQQKNSNESSTVGN